MKNVNRKLTRTPVIILAAVLALIISAATMTASAISMRKTSEAGNIGTKAAINTALSDAGISSGDATLTKSRLDIDDNAYEVEFTAGITKYDYKIDAKTSVVLEKEIGTLSSEDGIAADTKPTPVPTETTTVPETDKSYIGIEAAKTAALSDAGLTTSEVTFTKAKFDTDDFTAEYEIEFYTVTEKYDYDIDAATGEITQKSTEKYRPAETTPIYTVPEINISLEDAKKAALTDAGLTTSEVTFTKAKLDTDDFTTEYEIEFYTDSEKYDYDIDVTTGEITDKSKESRRPAGTVPASTAPVTTPVSGVPDTNISLAEAKAAALKDAGLATANVTFTKAELDIDDGVAKYDIEFRHGTVEYEYEINAENGVIIEKSSENHAPSGQSGIDYIGLDKAKSAALSHAGLDAGDVRFTKAKLEDDDDKTVYEIEFRYSVYEYEYEIDALTGSIIEFDKDIDD